MALDLNKWTVKAGEALQGAQSLAAEYSQQEIDVEHLLLALLAQDEGGRGRHVADRGGRLDEWVARGGLAAQHTAEPDQPVRDPGVLCAASGEWFLPHRRGSGAGLPDS